MLDRPRWKHRHGHGIATACLTIQPAVRAATSRIAGPCIPGPNSCVSSGLGNAEDPTGNYATGYGFLTDYLAEIFAELRRRNFQTHVNAWVDMGAMTGRNQDAIKKTAAGMLKLLHPHRTVDDISENEIAPVVELAVEMRKRTTDQLAVMLPAEFSKVQYSYQLQRSG